VLGEGFTRCFVHPFCLHQLPLYVQKTLYSFPFPFRVPCVTERQGLAGTSVDHLVQCPCQSRVTQSRLHRTLSRWILNISRGDSTAPLGSLFQCSVTLRVKKFLVFPSRSAGSAAPAVTLLLRPWHGHALPAPRCCSSTGLHPGPSSHLLCPAALPSRGSDAAALHASLGLLLCSPLPRSQVTLLA